MLFYIIVLYDIIRYYTIFCVVFPKQLFEEMNNAAFEDSLYVL